MDADTREIVKKASRRGAPGPRPDTLKFGDRTCDIIPISDPIIIDKTPNEIRALFVIILVLSLLLFYFAFMK